MSAPAILFQMFFEHNKVGWSENLWLKADNYADGLSLANAGVAKRLKLMNSEETEFMLTYARISDPTVKGDSMALDGFPRGGSGVIGTDFDADIDGHFISEPSDCLRIRLEDAVGRHSTLFFHGIPDGIYERGTVSVAGTSGLWRGKYASYTDWIFTNCYIRRKTAAGPPPTFAYTVPTRLIHRGLSNHRLGRPFGVSRGRRVLL